MYCTCTVLPPLSWPSLFNILGYPWVAGPLLAAAWTRHLMETFTVDIGRLEEDTESLSIYH